MHISPVSIHLTKRLQTAVLKTWCIVLALWKDFLSSISNGVLCHIMDKVLSTFSLKGVSLP